MARRDVVPRPKRKSEFDIVHATRDAAKGWQDLVATQRNAMVTVWERLTSDPLRDDGRTMYPLRGELATITRNGTSHQRWQCKPTEGGSARIWYFVDGTTVCLEQVHTHHPHQTK